VVNLLLLLLYACHKLDDAVSCYVVIIMLWLELYQDFWYTTSTSETQSSLSPLELSSSLTFLMLVRELEAPLHSPAGIVTGIVTAASKAYPLLVCIKTLISPLKGLIAKKHSLFLCTTLQDNNRLSSYFNTLALY
jgi:hypothetical protein